MRFTITSYLRSSKQLPTICGAYGGTVMKTAQPAPATIDAYLATFPPEVQAILE
jgi:hypothetical protein